MPGDPPIASSPVNSRPAWLVELGWGERYEVIGFIASGGMGQVWKARHLGTGDLVALKVLDPSRVGDDHLLARLETEAATLQNLLREGQHKNIVAVLDFATQAAHACMVMTFIPGKDLKTWCDAQRLDVKERAALIATVARAAGWCHRHGVVHRDLKPANILVHAGTGEPMIVDFSIAKSLGHLPITLTGEALGTTSYMAPEQLDSRRGAVTSCADVYALGATLYELLTHMLPHPGGLSQVMERHTNEVRPARPSVLKAEVPRDLDSICLKALANRSADRYADGTELADDLAAFLEGKPVAARPLSTPAYLMRQGRRHPYLCASVALSAVLVCGFLWEGQLMRHARRADGLRQTIATAMQARVSNPESLERTRHALDELAVLDAPRSAQMRKVWHDNVVEDVGAFLNKARLGDSMGAGMTETLNWLRQIDAPAAEKLQSQLNERLDRWEPLAEVRPPFGDLGGLFPHQGVQKDGDALLPVAIERGGSPVVVMVRQPMVSPCDVTAKFTPPLAGLQAVGLDFEFQKVRTRVMLASSVSTPQEVLQYIGGGKQASGFCVLYLERRGRFARGTVIPDGSLAHRRFTLNVRVEADHVLCKVDDRWSLRLDEEFVIPQFTPQNNFRLFWQRDLRLNALLIQSKGEKPRNSPLEQGDLLAAQCRWAEAQLKFEAHRGDASFGEEAAWKAAYAVYQQGQVKEALAAWQVIADRPSSLWRDLALYELWKHYALHDDSVQAEKLLKRLPAANTAGESLRAHITADDRKNLAASYEGLGGGINVLHPNVGELAQAVKAFELLEMPPLETASCFALAHHFNGMDEAARQMWVGGLEDAAKQEWSQSGQGAASPAAVACLEYWCRVDRSEKERRLQDCLGSWRKALPNDPTLWALVTEEQARILARAGRWDEALKTVSFIFEASGVSHGQLLAARLLEGMLQRQRGNESAAQTAWRQALSGAKENLRKPGTVSLCDLFALHCLARDWDQDTVADVLVSLVGKSQPGPRGTDLQGRFASTLLADPAFAEALKNLDDHGDGRRLIVDYVLVNEPARHLIRRAIGVAMERYFATTAFPAGATDEDAGRVWDTVNHLLPATAAGSLAGVDFFGFLEAWADPGKDGVLLPGSLPVPPDPARARLRWLLAERYISRGHREAALPLLLAAQDEPGLNANWRERIKALLKQP